MNERKSKSLIGNQLSEGVAENKSISIDREFEALTYPPYPRNKSSFHAAIDYAKREAFSRGYKEGQDNKERDLRYQFKRNMREFKQQLQTNMLDLFLREQDI